MNPFHLFFFFFCFSALASSGLAQVQFVDVTQSAGVDYLQSVSAGGTGSEAGVMTGGVAAADFDGDGWVDLFVTRFDGDALLFMNLGEDQSGAHRGFVDVAPTAFVPGSPSVLQNGASWGDVDGDGDLDLYLTSLYSQRYQLWINDGQGHFTEEAVQRGAAILSNNTRKGFGAAFGDFDRDGYLDLYVTEWGTFAPSGDHPRSHARLLHNRGVLAPGIFEDVTAAAGVALEGGAGVGPTASFSGVFAFTPRFADFDDDGWPDLAITGDFNTSRLFWNNGNGRFRDGTRTAHVGGDENGMGATVGDFDGDGNLDWFVTSIFDPFDTCSQGGCNWNSSGNRLYLGDGARQFADRTSAAGVRDGGWGWGATALDYDNDGRLDLAMTNGIVFPSTPVEDQFNTDPTKLWRNTPAGFVDVGASIGITDTRSGKGLLSLDYDRDGDLDLFVTNNSEHPTLYRNDGGNSNHWLQVTLSARGANVFGIGARIRVWPTLAATPIVREMSASSNYLSQDECLAQFGLGASANAARVEVRWPDGQISAWTQVSADQRLLLVQP